MCPKKAVYHRKKISFFYLHRYFLCVFWRKPQPNFITKKKPQTRWVRWKWRKLASPTSAKKWRIIRRYNNLKMRSLFSFVLAPVRQAASDVVQSIYWSILSPLSGLLPPPPRSVCPRMTCRFCVVHQYISVHFGAFATMLVLYALLQFTGQPDPRLGSGEGPWVKASHLHHPKRSSPPCSRVPLYLYGPHL